MISPRRFVAMLEVALIAPAAVFLSAVFVRNLSPAGLEPAASAHRVVGWFVARGQLGLAAVSVLPLAGLLAGAFFLHRAWARDPVFRATVGQARAAWRLYGQELVIALATLAAVPILLAVAIHVLAT